MLKTNNSKTKRIIIGLVLILQIIASILILLALYGFAERTIFANNSSIKFMIAFIIFSPELCISILTTNYILYEQFKILHNLIIITKTFQIVMVFLLIILGLSLDLLYVYQPWLFMLLGIIITYTIFNTVILILIKIKNKITR
ncbi:Hypothetical protein BPA_0088700 [Borrelia parkeri SLO]|uniref:Uncharacterized protein n=1 Tax=Borrelia parkeri SLO TaxID=1313294 RepID=A0ABN4C6B8_BORPR|nr:hypothetical protein [Borrelia parkeri]AHH09574.1 Hypothetical protein BPA_0088700 [Borrelia parkeri SLO]UPA10527.1 hypothetical protein bpSLO_000351 [Borrelia parkeri]